MAMMMMSRSTLHLISCENSPGFQKADAGCSSHGTLSARALSVLPRASYFDHHNQTYIKNGRLRCFYNGRSFTCEASSGGHRRNPDFSRQRNSHSLRGRNQHNEEKDRFDSLDEPAMLSSKNGPILSLSNSTKFQATTSPGPREKEIIELFRKVQAQLRERAAVKREDKRDEEASKGQGKENETVDSLLSLLRKHSGERGKKKASSFSSRDAILEQPEGNGVYCEDQSTSHVNSRIEEHNPASLTRPASSFRRKSPVPKFKSQPTYSDENTFASAPSYNSGLNQKQNPVELHHEPEYEPRLEREPELKLKSFYQEDNDGQVDLDEELDDDDDDESLDDEETGQDVIKHEDLSVLKLTELRTLAKSRGLKGFSKMKKAELVKLLSDESD